MQWGETRGCRGRCTCVEVIVCDSFRSKTPELFEAFGKYGKVKDCTVCKHPGGESRGFGFVTFLTKGSGHGHTSVRSVLRLVT